MTTATDLTTRAPPTVEGVRITIPAREALVAAGNVVEQIDDSPTGYALFRVTIHRPPHGIVEVLIGNGNDQCHGLRLDDEIAYPGEWPHGKGISWWERGRWVGCPTCEQALVWYEAGYVPGHRICLRGHHADLGTDGRTAQERKMT